MMLCSAAAIAKKYPSIMVTGSVSEFVNGPYHYRGESGGFHFYNKAGSPVDDTHAVVVHTPNHGGEWDIYDQAGTFAARALLAGDNPTNTEFPYDPLNIWTDGITIVEL